MSETKTYTADELVGLALHYARRAAGYGQKDFAESYNLEDAARVNDIERGLDGPEAWRKLSGLCTIYNAGGLPKGPPAPPFDPPEAQKKHG